MHDHDQLFDRFRGRLIVSCQAQPGEALHGAEHMVAMARAVIDGGAAAIRCESPADVRAIRAITDLPLIGLWKIGSEGVYITPTVEAAVEISEAGADIVAIDATDRPRPDGRSLQETIRELAARGIIVLADVATVAEGVAAAAAGAAMVSTTLSGYTPETAASEGPDIDLVAELARRIDVPVLAEGRIRRPEQVAAAYAAGAFSVVVGGAITRPASITAEFVEAVPVRTDETPTGGNRV